MGQDDARLARHCTVLAVDLPGLGDSAPPADGAYDAPAAAPALLHALLGQLGHRRIRLVGHDVGAWVAGAYAAHYSPTCSSWCCSMPNCQVRPPQWNPPKLPRRVKAEQLAFNPLADLPEIVRGGSAPT
ncbi:MAG: alpha/beta hydrolase [Hymenobacter sp.]